jgi:peptidoglycan/LPS O-acetylase OafA/YrhL
MDFLRSRMTLAQTNPTAYVALEFAILVSSVCVVSWTSWNLFEKHFLKLKRFFEYSVVHR